MGRPSVLRQISTVCFVVCAGGTHLGCNTLRLSGNPVAPLTGTGAFDGTNGNKVVVDPLAGRLHAVYADQGSIWYVWSTDGAGWSAPLPISGLLSACREPSIAVGGCGELGVAFRCLGGLYYTFGPGPSWSIASLVDANGAQPSMVASGNTIHLAYRYSSSDIFYRTFPIKSPSPTTFTNYEYVAGPFPLSGISALRFFPSIAVTATTPPRIFVALMEQVDRSPEWDTSCASGFYCKCNPTAACFWNHVFVMERTTLCSPIPSHPWCRSFASTDHTDTGGVLSKPAGLASCSLSVSGSGHLYLAWSEVWKNVPRTMLAHSASGTLNSWSVSPLVPVPVFTTTDILAGSGTSFRVAWSDLTNPILSHGPTFYITGNWSSGPAPTFSSSPILVTTGAAAGRSPQALLWSRSCLNGGGLCSIATIFEDKGSSTFSLKQDSTCTSPNGPPTCFLPIPPGCFAQ